VSGRRAFEQRLRHRVTNRATDAIGGRSSDPEHVKELVKSYVGEIVDSMGELDSLVSYSAEFSDRQKGLLEVEVVYDTGDSLSFEVQT